MVDKTKCFFQKIYKIVYMLYTYITNRNITDYSTLVKIIEKCRAKTVNFMFFYCKMKQKDMKTILCE